MVNWRRTGNRRVLTTPRPCFQHDGAGGVPFSRCGFTSRYLNLIPTRPLRLYNNQTQDVLMLPAGGTVRVLGGRRCPICRFEIMTYLTPDGRGFPLCPYCFNHPLPDQHGPGAAPMARGGTGGCYESPLGDGHPLIEEVAVCGDDASGGVFILEKLENQGGGGNQVSRELPSAHHTR